MNGRLIIFTSLPKVGGHSAITLGVCRLLRPYFEHVEIWCKVMPDHGHSPEVAAKLREMGCEVTLLSDLKGRLAIGAVARCLLKARRERPDVFLTLAMRHLSVVLAAAVGAPRSVYYHITHDLNDATISRLKGCARVFSKVAFICPATYDAFPGAEKDPSFTWFPQPSEIPVQNPEKLVAERLAQLGEAEPIRFGLIGRLTEAKGARVMLNFAETAKVPCSLRVAGVGPFEAEFVARSQSNEGRNCTVIFQGAYDASSRERVLRAFFSKIDCLVVPSQDEWETLSLAALEAMQHGVPVIMCRAGGLVSFSHRDLGPAPAAVVDLVEVNSMPDALDARAVKPRGDIEETVNGCRRHYAEYFEDSRVLQRWLDVVRPQS